MLGQMMDIPLLTSSLLVHAERQHGDTEIVTRTVEGPIHRYTYRDAHKRSKQLAAALEQLGIKHGDRVATLAWNTHRHFEIYYGVAGMGAICHTINPRLFPEQIVYIANHAEDVYLFVDLTFVPLIEKLRTWRRSFSLGSMSSSFILCSPVGCFDQRGAIIICWKERYKLRY